MDIYILTEFQEIIQLMICLLQSDRSAKAPPSWVIVRSKLYERRHKKIFVHLLQFSNGYAIIE